MGEAPGVEHRRGDHRRLAGPQRDLREQRRRRLERVAAAWRAAPFGVPVVPEVRITTRPLSRRRLQARRRRRARSAPRASDRPARPARSVPSGSRQATKRGPPAGAVAHEVARTPRRRSAATGPRARSTSAICGPAKAVFRYSAPAPSFEHGDGRLDEAAVVAAHDRHAVAFADARPARARGRARWCAGAPRAKVSVPRSSTIAGAVGVARRRDRSRRAAGVGPSGAAPQRAQRPVGPRRLEHARCRAASVRPAACAWPCGVHTLTLSRERRPDVPARPATGR